MFRLVNSCEIDIRAWDACVLSSKYFRHYYLSYFLNNACDQWDALVAEDYKWVWPLPIKNVFIKKIYQPLLAQQLGPVAKGDISEDELFDALRLLKKKYPVGSIKFNSSIKRVPLIDTTKGTNVELDLKLPYEKIKKNYSRSTKSNLKKAEKAALTVDRNSDYDPWAVSTFQKTVGQRIDSLQQSFYLAVKNIYTAFQERGEAETFVAKDTFGNEMAQVLLLNSNKRLLFFFSASNDEARNCGAMHFVIDQIIQQYCEKQEVFDFEGSNDKNLAFFYTGFGGTEQVYLHGRFSKFPKSFQRILKL